MTKEQLETNLSALKLLQSETNDKLESFKQQVQDTEKKLEDINKPVLKPIYFDKIHEAVEEGIGNFSFDNQDNYEKEFGMEYDGKVYLDSIDLTCTHELVENIVKEVYKLFVEDECPPETE
jgi:tRNA G18 (ribose-2'-O)-methylase SpoU